VIYAKGAVLADPVGTAPSSCTSRASGRGVRLDAVAGRSHPQRVWTSSRHSQQGHRATDRCQAARRDAPPGGHLL